MSGLAKFCGSTEVVTSMGETIGTDLAVLHGFAQTGVGDEGLGPTFSESETCCA